MAQIWNYFLNKFALEDQTLRAAYEHLWSSAELCNRTIDQFMVFVYDLRCKLNRAGVAASVDQLQDLLFRVCRKEPRYTTAISTMENTLLETAPSLDQVVARLTAIDVREL